MIWKDTNGVWVPPKFETSEKLIQIEIRFLANTFLLIFFESHSKLRFQCFECYIRILNVYPWIIYMYVLYVYIYICIVFYIYVLCICTIYTFALYMIYPNVLMYYTYATFIYTYIHIYIYDLSLSLSKASMKRSVDIPENETLHLCTLKYSIDSKISRVTQPQTTKKHPPSSPNDSTRCS